MHRFRTWQLFAICVLVWGTTWHAITYQLGDLRARVRRRVALRARRRCRAAGLRPGAASRCASRRATTRRSRCRASSSTACRTSASTTPSASCRRGWSRSATRRRRCSRASARRCCSARRSARALRRRRRARAGRRRAHLLARDRRGPRAASTRTLGAIFTVGSVLLSAVGSLVASRNRHRGVPLLPAMGFGMLYGAAAALARRDRARPRRRLADARRAGGSRSPSWPSPARCSPSPASSRCRTALGPGPAGTVGVMTPLLALVVSLAVRGLSARRC